MKLGNKYEGGGCFAITVTEIGRTRAMAKLLHVYLANSCRTNRFHHRLLFRYTMYKLLLRADSGNIVFKTIGR